jgi:tetratricopeptide (TPR) repeat protein
MADKRLILLKRANKLFRQGKTGAAVKEYEKIIAIKPDDLEVRRIVGDLQLRQNNIPGAVDQFGWIADYYLKEGYFAKAIAMYKRITRINPNSEQTLFKLADLYTKQGLVIEAKQIYLDIAEECKRQNNQKKALGMYKKILEFDRHNIKMRNLLADNYLKEGMAQNAIDEYVTSADILINKKDYQRAEELLLNVLEKIKNPKIIEKLLNCYTSQNEDDKAINLLKNLGDEIYKDANLLKALGELYLKKNLMNEAEKIFIKVAEIDPEEAEVIMRLGKVYLQREEYDRTYELFLPIVEKNVKNSKYEEAASLLRFIIASNNTYLPALTKLASIFKVSGKKNNLIALYESLIPVYEKKGMKEQLKEILEELIKLSDSPFTYEEYLEKLTGQREMEIEEEAGAERESEFISHNLRIVEEAIKVIDYEKAINTLLKSKTTFPQNVEIRQKLFEVFQLADQVEAAVEEGKGLLEIYKSRDMGEAYSELFDKLAVLSPEDEKILEISVEEKTSIDIDIKSEELVEEMGALSGSGMHAEVKLEGESGAQDEPLVLSEEQSIPDFEAQEKDKPSKSLSTYLSELDFYINDRYFGEAEKLIKGLEQKYPGNKELIAKIKKYENTRQQQAEPAEEIRAHTEPIAVEEAKDFLMESSASGKDLAVGYDDSNLEIEFGEPEEPMELKLSDEDELSSPSEVDLDLRIGEPASGEIPDFGSPEELELPKDEFQAFDEEPLTLTPEEEEGQSEAAFEIERSIAEESHSAQEYEDSKMGIKIEPFEPPEQISIEKEEVSDLENVDFEIEFEEPVKTDDLPLAEIDREELIQSPSVEHREASSDSHAMSGAEELDLDSIMMDEGAVVEAEGPFKEIADHDLGYDSDEKLLEGEALFLEEAYFESEKSVGGEMEAILFWLKEVEKQRTSTIEKNMMEIFDEFKKGVDEKIGKEDYDTRYNLGIAYKEMGLLEEAIHEFLISSKHPLKFFDSAGLLGMCFREKGMYSEAISWFEKAAEVPNRKRDEYLAVNYEMVLTYRLQENYESAKKYAEAILKIEPNFRNITEIYEDIKKVLPHK